MRTFNIQHWDTLQFAQNKDAWQTLLSKSSADPLFMSWHWQHQWWQLYAKQNQLKLCLLACYCDKELVGLAPLYLYETKLLKYITVTRLTGIGNRFRKPLGIRAEYQSFICQNNSSEVYQALWGYIFENISWQEAYFSDVLMASPCYQQLQARPEIKKVYQRIDGQDTSYSVNTQGNFKEYLSSLGKNSRLKLFNRRKLLEKKGSVELSHVKLEDYDALLEVLNRFHQKRWGYVSLSETNREFLKNMMQHSDNQSSLASLLTLDGEPLSTMLNLQFNGRVYNIQLGFIESFDSKISLGTLHLGYAIEAAFADPGINYFDLLAGTGKNDNYKTRIAKKDAEMISLQMVKPPLLKLIYQSYDYYQKLKRKVHRLSNSIKN